MRNILVFPLSPSGKKRPETLPAFIFVLVWLMLAPNQIFSQSTPDRPAFYPIAEHTYGIKEGLADMAVEKVFLDKAGRLNIHNSGATASGSWLYEYYGSRTHPAGF